MKLLKSMPQDTAFFERYADLTHSLTKVAIIAQVVTGAAEIGILYALLYPSINDLAPNYAGKLSTIAAFFCATLLQFGLKKVFPYAVRAFIFKRWKGLDCAFSVSVIILTIALLAVSIFLSWKGSKDIASFAVAKPTEKTTTAQDSAKNAVLIAANGRFTTDSATIETKYKGKAEALTAEFNGRIGSIEGKANQTVTSAPSWSKSLRSQAGALRSEMSTKLAQLQANKATEIQAKSDKRQSDIDKATDRANSQTDAILNENKTAKDAATAKANSYSGYIGYFTLLCYIFFLFTYILNEIYHKGAKIDLTPVPSQRHFTPSVIAEFFEALKERIDVNLRTRVYNFANATDAQPLPDAMRSLYDFKADVLTNTQKVETTAKEAKVIKLPLKLPFIPAIAATTETEPTEKRQIGFNKTKPKEENPTDDKDNQRNASIRNAYEPNETSKYAVLNCAYEACGKAFERRTTFQKYCCEECRIAAFELRTGKQLKKQPKKS